MIDHHIVGFSHSSWTMWGWLIWFSTSLDTHIGKIRLLFWVNTLKSNGQVMWFFSISLLMLHLWLRADITFLKARDLQRDPTCSNMSKFCSPCCSLQECQAVSSCVMRQNQACLNHAANMKILKLRLVFRTDVSVGAMRIKPEFLWYPQQLVVLVCPAHWKMQEPNDVELID